MRSMQTPISIIVPAYNIENYISRCLDSLISQTWKNLQIIVVDDGSTDHTGEIIDNYAQKDPRFFAIHKENEGVSKARMAGVEYANGVYIGFVDGDDAAEPELFEHLVKNAQEHCADISHCGYRTIFPEGKVKQANGTGLIEDQDQRSGLKALLTGEYVEPGLCNKLYTLKLLRSSLNSPLWDPDIKINEDLLLNYIAFKEAKQSVYEDSYLYNYYKRPGSASSKVFQSYKITDPIKVISIIRADTKEDKELYGIVYDRYLRLLINTSQQQNSIEEARAARATLKAEMKDRKEFLSGNSKKLRMMAFGATRMPGLYRIVRKIYDKTAEERAKNEGKA